ncbi:MAG: hypothetical protein JWP32_2905 [Schumannella sp.]|nr:hypothetical protein [Schumannella sp.]
MAVGSGLSATFGIATETTPGVPVAVTRFAEFDSETLSSKKHTVQGAGLRGGGLVKRGARRQVVGREAGGDVSFDIATNGFGLFLQHMLGSFSTTPTSLGGGLFRQVHNVGSLQGKAFTTQIVKPDTSGVLAPEAFTYPGCKVVDWEISAQQNAEVKLKLSIDALDEATPANSFAPTTVSAATTAGATSFTSAATIPAGTYVAIDSGLVREVVLTGTPTGAGPFTIPVAAGLKFAHAAGVSVASATGANYGAVTAMQTAAYASGAGLFNFSEGTLVVGGSTTVVSGVWTNTGGAAAANVRSVALKGTNPLKVDRWGMGSQVRSEQIENNWRSYTATVELEFNSRYLYDVYAADAALTLQITFTDVSGAVLQFYCPVGFQNDGASPNVSGPDIIIQKLAFEILDDGANGALQAVYTSTDAAV